MRYILTSHAIILQLNHRQTSGIVSASQTTRSLNTRVWKLKSSISISTCSTIEWKVISYQLSVQVLDAVDKGAALKRQFSLCGQLWSVGRE